MVVPGVAIGAAISLTLTALARGILYGLTSTEPGVGLLAATILSACALLAGWVPACRAARVIRLVAVRHEWRT